MSKNLKFNIDKDIVRENNNNTNAKKIHKKECYTMSNRNSKSNLQNMKMEAANEVGVNLKQGYNGDITSKDAGSVGGQMVKKMVASYTGNSTTPGSSSNSSTSGR